MSLQLNLSPSEKATVERALHDATAKPENSVTNPPPNQMAAYGTRFATFQKRVAGMKCTDEASYRANMKAIRKLLDDDDGERSEHTRQSTLAGGQYRTFGGITEFTPIRR